MFFSRRSKRRGPTTEPSRVEPTVSGTARTRAHTPDKFHSDISAMIANVDARMHTQLQTCAQHAPANFLGDSVDQYSSIKGGYDRSQPNISDGLLGFFISQTFIGHQLCALLAQHWLIDKACTMPARDAVRNGFEIRTNEGDEFESPEIVKQINKWDRRYKLRSNCVEFVRMGRIFGIRIALFRVESTDPDYYEKPFNLDGVTPGSYKGITQIDPYWMAPELDRQSATNPAYQHFYEPTYWIINGKRFHRSHLVIFRNSPPPDILKPVYLYGGVPVPQKIVERVYAAERVANEGPLLAMTKRTNWIKTDLAKVFANGQTFVQRIMEWVAFRDNYGIKVLGRDDEIGQFDTALTDLDNVTMNSYQLVAAAAGVPATKLLGTTPKGFNATGQYESRSYHEELETIQENDLSPLVERHHQLVMRSFIVPWMRKNVDAAFTPVGVGHNWNAVDVPTAKEQAEINEIKGRTDQVLLDTGAIDPYDIRTRLIGDKTSGYNALAAVERPEGDEPGNMEATAAQQPMPQMMEAADGVQLWSNQQYLNPDIVQAKRQARDYRVQVSPVMFDPERKVQFRIVIDGHHSLVAARLDGVAPQLEEGDYSASDYVALLELPG